MASEVFTRSATIAAPQTELRDWHFRPGAFARLNPPWEPVEHLSGTSTIEEGKEFEFRVGRPPFSMRWRGRYRITPDGFEDSQIKGPFKTWKHNHIFKSGDGDSSTLTDHVQFDYPFGPLGKLVAKPFIEKKLDRMFRYRHEVTKKDLRSRSVNPPPQGLHILVTGATGLIGSALCPYLTTQGHTVHRVTRSPSSPDDICWEPDKGSIKWPEHLNIDAVIHLAGENVSDGRWTSEKMSAIEQSRVHSTRTIVRAMLERENPPKVLVCASGSSIYPQKAGPYTEDGPLGDHFLADVCKKWEAETLTLESRGIRVVIPRIGAVTSYQGGIVRKMLPLIQFGLGQLQAGGTTISPGSR